MSNSFHAVTNLLQRWDARGAETGNPAFKEAADDLVAEFTPDKSKQSDPDAVIFHEHRPIFSEMGILAMSTDGHEVTFSTAAFVQLAKLLEEAKAARG